MSDRSRYGKIVCMRHTRLTIMVPYESSPPTDPQVYQSITELDPDHVLASPEWLSP